MHPLSALFNRSVEVENVVVESAEAGDANHAVELVENVVVPSVLQDVALAVNVVAEEENHAVAVNAPKNAVLVAVVRKSTENVEPKEHVDHEDGAVAANHSVEISAVDIINTVAISPTHRV